MAAINPGDIVDVTLIGSSLAQFEVLKIPSNTEDYWEFQNQVTLVVVAVPRPVSITKAP